MQRVSYCLPTRASHDVFRCAAVSQHSCPLSPGGLSIPPGTGSVGHDWEALVLRITMSQVITPAEEYQAICVFLLQVMNEAGLQGGHSSRITRMSGSNRVGRC